MKTLIITTFLLLVAVGASAQLTHNSPTTNNTNAPVTIEVDKTPKPAAKPKPYQKIATLTIALNLEAGKVTDARLLKNRRLNSVAPKVFARQAGDWQVTLIGEREYSFYVISPAYREAEAHRSSDNRYQWVAQDGRIDWPLIVPLYKDGKAINVERVLVRDAKTGERIFEARI